jgi:hypothetical protein
MTKADELKALQEEALALIDRKERDELIEEALKYVDQYEEKQKTAEAEEYLKSKDMGQGSAALYGVGRGLTAEMLPALAGVGAVGLEAAERFGDIVNQYDTKKPEYSDIFWDKRAEEIKKQKALEQVYPKTTYGGMVPGVIASSLAAPAAKTIKGGMALGAAYGGASALGTAESPEEVAFQIGGGGVLGGAAPLAITALRKGSEKLAPAAGRASQNFRAWLESALQRETKLTPEQITVLIDSNIGSQVRDPNKALQLLKEAAQEVQMNPEMMARQKKFMGAGLEPATPGQLQQRFYKDPTPAQYAEALVKNQSEEARKLGLKQMETYESKLQPFRERGEETLEEFGAKLVGETDKAKAAAGEKIGEFKKQIQGELIREDTKVPTPPIIETLYEPHELSILKKYSDLVDNAQTYLELEHYNTRIKHAYDAEMARTKNNGNSLTKALKNLRDNIKSTIKREFPGKPGEAYEQYAIASDVYDDTLKGLHETGKKKDIFGKITKSSEDYQQFKKMVDAFDKPGILDMVKDQYERELFSKPNWQTYWRKTAKKNPVYKNIFTPEQIEYFDLLADYSDAIFSTSSMVNPSRTALTQSFVDFISDKAKEGVGLTGILSNFKAAVESGRKYSQLQKATKLLKEGADPGQAEKAWIQKKLEWPELGPISRSAYDRGMTIAPQIGPKFLQQDPSELFTGEEGKMNKLRMLKLGRMPQNVLEEVRPTEGASANLFDSMTRSVEEQSAEPLTATLSYYTNKYGSPAAKKIFSKIGSIEGILTKGKLYRALNGLPVEAQADLIMDFESSYKRSKKDTPVVFNTEDIPFVIKDISRSNVSNISKAKMINSLTKMGMVSPELYDELVQDKIPRTKEPLEDKRYYQRLDTRR